MDQLDIKTKEGYGFIMFKTRLGPIRVFEAGDTHRIKGTKIECRKVLERSDMLQQVHENSSNQQARAQLVTKPSPMKVYTPQPVSEWDRKSGRTSGLDTTMRTTEGGPNSATPMKRSLRNTGQVFKFPPEYGQNPDDSFLTHHEHQMHQSTGGQHLVEAFPPGQRDNNVEPISDKTTVQIESKPVQIQAQTGMTNSILSFLDEDDEPWPEEISRSRLTIIPQISEEEDGDLGDK